MLGFADQFRENTLLKNNLVQLGYEVPRTTWSLLQPNDNSQPNPLCDTPHEGERYIATRNGHSTHARSSNTAFDDRWSVSSNVHLPFSRPNLISTATIAPASRKRSLDVMIDHKQDDTLLSKRQRSKQLMPPPPVPIRHTASSSHYEPEDKNSERLYSSKHRFTRPPTTAQDEVIQVSRLNPSGEPYRPVGEFERENSRWETSSRHSLQSEMDYIGGHNRHIRHNDAHQDYHYRRLGITSNNRTPSRSCARPVREPSAMQSTLQYDREQWRPSTERPFQSQSPRMTKEQSQAQKHPSRSVSSHFFQPQLPTQRSNVANHFRPIGAVVRPSEQVADLGVYKMVPPPSRGRRNSTLNSLSFINEPYTTLNEPIYPTVNQRPAIASRRLSTRSLAGFSHSSRSPQPRRLLSLSGFVQNNRDEHNHVRQRFHTNLETSGSHRRYDPAFVSGHTQRSSFSTATPPSGPLRNGVRSSRGVFTSAGVGGARRKLVR
jgi:hypothetical protein